MKFFFKRQPSTADAVTLMNGSHEEAGGSGFANPDDSLPSNRDSEWSKERSLQQAELSDVHHNSQTGCGRRVMEYVVARGLHVVDISLGTALIVYGSLLCTQFQTTAMAAVLFCLTLGTIHLVTSSLGVISLCTRRCARFGLLVSGYIGPYVALVYLTLLFALIFGEDGFEQYLDNHKEVMYLGPNVADNVRKLMPLFYTILIVLGLLEASRKDVMLNIHQRLFRYEAEEALIPLSNENATMPNNTLAEALLEENELGTGQRTGESGGSVGKETTGTPKWWEENVT